MNEKQSYTEYNVIVPTQDFIITFEDYNSNNRDTIHVTVDGVPASTAGFTVLRISATVIQLTPAVETGSVVRLQRETDIDNTFYRFTAGAIFTAGNVDKNFQQILHSQQEVRDGFIKLSSDVYPLVNGLEEALQQASDASQAAQDAADAAEEAAQVTRSTSQVVHLNGETQQQIDDYIGATWYARTGGYGVNDKARLSTGEVVVSTIAENTNNPNVNMTGWFNPTRYNQPIDFAMFNADNTGLTACDAEIQAAFDLAEELKLPLYNFSGTYLLNDVNAITIACSYDLTGTVFKCGSNFAGIEITRRAITTSETSGALIDLLKTQGILAAGACNLSVLASNPILNNKYFKLYTSQQMYTYRGNIQNRFELNRMLKRGQMLGSFMFDLDFSLLTKIDYQDVAETYLCGTGLTLDETLVANNVTLVRVKNGNGFRLGNFKFIDNASAVAANTKDKLSIDNTAHDIKIDGMDTSAVYIDAANRSNYTVVMGENFDVEINNINSDGYGWGAIGGNNCRRVTFNNCQLNRIDFHKPFHEYLRINDCVIGNWGVLVTALGDCIINNPRFLARKAYVNDGIVRSREDTGGWCNGNLIINNPVFDGNPTALLDLLRCQIDTSNPIPAGSPIAAEFWTNVTINSASEHNSILATILNSNQSASTLAIKPPKSIEINGFKFDKSAFISMYMNRFALRSEGTVFKLSDSNIDTLNFLDPDSLGNKLIANIDRCFGFNNNGLKLINTCNGAFYVNNGKTFEYREYSGAFTTFTPKVKFNGGTFGNTTSTRYFDLQNTAKSRVHAVNVDMIYSSDSAMRLDTHFFKPTMCTWNGEQNFPLYLGGGSAGSATFTLPTGGDVTLMIKNSAGNVDIVTVDTTKAVTNNLPNCSGTIASVISGSNTNFTVTAATLLSVHLVS